MSRSEQAALVAWINSFRPARRVTSFEQLADGKALAEVLASVDSTHFKSTPVRGGAGPSSENWVLKTNALKRLYRQLLSYPLPPPHHPLSTSTLPEPSFSTVVKTPTSTEGLSGLIQLARMVLCLAVWAPGNEKVISKIQALGEGHMAELMRGIEEVMGSMPPEDEVYDAVGGTSGVVGGDEDGDGRSRRSIGSSRRSSPEKKPTRPPSPPVAGLRSERDKLASDNDNLRVRLDQLSSQLSDLTSELEEVRIERDEALDRFASARDTQSSALRTSQTATTQSESLRSDLARSEEQVARLEDELAKRVERLNEMGKQVEELKKEVGDVEKLRDQLDEYRHAADKLQKSENVIEKYKKKLDESAGLRREMRNLESENATLLSTNTSLEAEMRKFTSTKSVLEGYKAQVEEQESQLARQTVEIGDLHEQLEASQAHIAELEDEGRDGETARGRRRSGDPDGSQGSPGVGVRGSMISLDGAREGMNLGEELGDSRETKTGLRTKIRQLEARLANSITGSEQPGEGDLQVQLEETRKAKDEFRIEAIEAARDVERLKAQIERLILQPGNSKGRVGAEDAGDGKGNGARGEKDKEEVERLKLRLEEMRDKDRLQMEEINRLLMEKVELQSSGIDQRERMLVREKEFGDLRASLIKEGASPEVHKQLGELVERNLVLQQEVDRLRVAPPLSAPASAESDEYSEPSPRATEDASAAFELAQQSYESQISTLKAQLRSEQQSREQLGRRYAKESQLMLSAWTELGNRVARDHVGQSVSVALANMGKRGHQSKALPGGWLGRQRRWVEDGMFSR